MSKEYWTKKRFDSLRTKWSDRTLQVWIKHMTVNPDCPAKVLRWLKNEQMRRAIA